MSYIGTEPKDIRSFGRTKFDYTATQGQTAFTGADDDGKVLAFTVGQIEVYVNGILMDDSDFTTTGTGTVTLASAANLNDVINIVSFESNIPDNDYVPASGGTFTGNVTNSGNVTVGGTLGVTGATTMSGDLTISTTAGQLKLTDTDGTEQNTTIKQSGGNLFIQARDNTNNAGIVFAGNGGGNYDEHMRITSSGKVGIGTNAPAKPLSVVKAGGGDFIAEFQNTTSGTPYGIHVKDAASGANGYPLFQVTNSAGNSTYFRVDSGTGRVFTPNQVFFDAYLSGNYTSGSSGVYNISTSANWGTHTNTGGHFVTGTGTFTAPSAGRYLFFAGLGVQSYPTSAYLSCEFEVNGSRRYIHWFSNYGTSYAAANNTAVINLNANDYVRLVSETHQSATYIGTASGIYSHFGGYLLG